MAANKTFRSGPTALTSTLTTNILNPPTATGGVGAGSSGNYIILRQISVFNKTNNPATYTLYLGASGANAAGTELALAVTVTGNSWSDRYFSSGLRLDTTDFLVGGASSPSTLDILLIGEIGVAG